MKKELWGIPSDYCDFCEVLLADAVLKNGSVICQPCIKEKGL